MGIVWEYEKSVLAAGDGKQQYVCVTGSWDLLSSWLVRSLLDKGYNVRSTVPINAGGNPDQYHHCRSLQLAIASSLPSSWFRDLCESRTPWTKGIFMGGRWMSADEAAELMALPGAEERLELTRADLMDYGSLVEAFMGCFGVFHTTSPSDLVSNYPVKHLISFTTSPYAKHLEGLEPWVVFRIEFLLQIE